MARHGPRRQDDDLGRDVLWLGSQTHTFHFYQYLGLIPRCAIHDHYDLQHELGRGTYAIVRHAVHLRTGREVAVKVIDCAVKLRTNEGREELFREIDIMEGVRHGGVVEMREYFLDEAGGKLCMWFCTRCRLSLLLIFGGT